MLSGLFADLIPYAVLALGIVGGLLGWNRKTKKDAERATRSELDRAAKDEYVKDRKEIDNAKPVDTDAVSARDRLRDFADRNR